MIRPARNRLASPAVRSGAALLCAVLVGCSLLLGATAPVAATEHEPGEEGSAVASATPLEVTIRTLAPAVIPRRGRIALTGTVTNRSESTWTDLNVYLLMSAQPITSAAGLAEATGSDPVAEVGARITTPGLYDEVSDLEPGESTTYSLSVPVGELPASQEGVYWLGVHVLGSNEDGRVDGADGRARTFVPLVRGEEPRATLSVVVPVKSRVQRSRDGTLVNPESVGSRVAEEGRLTRLLQLSDTSGELPLTWVVDPALLAGLASLSAGNPPFDTGPSNGSAGNREQPAPAEPGDEEGAEAEDLADEAADAGAWLGEFVAQASDHAVMTVPYGDLDVAAVLRRSDRAVYDRATSLSALTMEQLGVRGTPVLAPPDGRLPSAALESLDTSATLLLDEGAVDTDARVVRLREGHLAVRASQAARIGGPTPGDPYTALALRQRILAEAAVQALADTPQEPLVITTPETWDPGEDWRSAAFFPAMDQPWLRTVNLPFAAVLAPPAAYDGGLSYDRAFQRAELPERNLAAARDLDAAGAVLADLLARNDTIDDQVGSAAMLGASFNARDHPGRARARVQRTAAGVRERLEQVYVESSPLVTMSSETGNFSVTVVNGLDEAVTVGISAETGTPELEIGSPDLVSLGPGQRASVRLSVKATDTGVHSVSIMPTTQDGRPLGRATRIKVRSSQVGLVIWFIMGTGGVVFVAAISMRIARRVRDRKRTHGPVLKESTP